MSGTTPGTVNVACTQKVCSSPGVLLLITPSEKKFCGAAMFCNGKISLTFFVKICHLLQVLKLEGLSDTQRA
jgi:hypothetical protein